MPTAKTPVIEHLYKRWKAGVLPDGIVRQRDVVEAIKHTGVDLKTGNPANFLKDIIRKNTANDHWPELLATARITARQRYGGERVFEFVPFRPEQTVPFPDNFEPDDSTPIHHLQSATIPFVARELGRHEESWLMQVAVELRVIESQLALFSPLRGRLRDVTHLQMSMKTQPEIDGVFLISHGISRALSNGPDLYSLVTCEAKQLNERILEDQIREQVAMAFSQTYTLKKPEIGAVKPMAIQVRCSFGTAGPIYGIYVVEFQRVSRRIFEARYAPRSKNDPRLYDMPLLSVSQTLYKLMPAVRGIDNRTRTGHSAAKRSRTPGKRSRNSGD